MAAKRTKPKSTSAPTVVTEDQKMIDREAFDWGVRLTAHPFQGTENHALVIRSEIRNYRAGRGSEVYITFPAASLQNPMRLLDARLGTRPWEPSSPTRGPCRPRCGRPLVALARRKASCYGRVSQW